MEPPDSFTDRPAVMDDRRRRIHEILADRTPRIAAIYYSAVVVFDSGLPDRAALCAHGLRELVEKLPLDLEGIPEERRDDRKLRARAQQLAACFDVTVRSPMRKDGGWTAIDKRVAKLLRELEEFVTWLRDDFPTRRVEVARGLRRMDPSLPGLPQHLVDDDAGRWLDWRRFFQNVAHHTLVVSDDEFRRQVEALEEYLLRRLAPRTFENEAAIDQFVAEMEANDQTDR
jgi:hypothetical protein